MICVIDYKAGNLTSVYLALVSLGYTDIVISGDPQVVQKSTRIIFPGVGAAGTAMHQLRLQGLDNVLREKIQEGIPFLGICLGTQILLTESEEDNGTTCLNILPGKVKRFCPQSKFDKIPHMGWNAVEILRPHPLFQGIDSGTEFYFVHTYYPSPNCQSAVLGTTDYAGIRFASVIGEKNLVATQFHPERSGRMGLRLLKNFMEWDGVC